MTIDLTNCTSNTYIHLFSPNFPDELITRTLSFVSSEDLSRLAQVSKRGRELADIGWGESVRHWEQLDSNSIKERDTDQKLQLAASLIKALRIAESIDKACGTSQKPGWVDKFQNRFPCANDPKPTYIEALHALGNPDFSDDAQIRKLCLETPGFLHSCREKCRRVIKETTPLTDADKAALLEEITIKAFSQCSTVKSSSWEVRSPTVGMLWSLYTAFDSNKCSGFVHTFEQREPEIKRQFKFALWLNASRGNPDFAKGQPDWAGEQLRAGSFNRLELMRAAARIAQAPSEERITPIKLFTLLSSPTIRDNEIREACFSRIPAPQMEAIKYSMWRIQLSDEKGDSRFSDGNPDWAGDQFIGKIRRE